MKDILQWEIRSRPIAARGESTEDAQRRIKGLEKEPKDYMCIVTETKAK